MNENGQKKQRPTAALPQEKGGGLAAVNAQKERRDFGRAVSLFIVVQEKIVRPMLVVCPSALADALADAPADPP